ncbi:MAG: peptide MFS transporter [Vicinamibacterales bacterium]
MSASARVGRITTMPASPSSAERTARHPRGLYVLFFTELWERYSFYSMMAILTLYMDEALHFDAQRIGRVYGGYIGGVYLLPLVGGWLADRVLGFYRAVIIGGIIMMAGHLVLAVESLPFFYAGLVLLACGSGMLKPNVSTIVGNLYRDRPELRDAGFNLFYMGINLGALTAPLVVAWLRAHYGWSVAFGSAAVAMLASLVVFVTGRRHVAEAAAMAPPAVASDTGSRSDDYARVTTLLIIFGVSALFWLAFYQNAFTLTFWARDNTLTDIASESFQSVEPLGVIVFSGSLVAGWAWLGRRNLEPSTPAKMLIGVLLVAAAFGVMTVAALSGGDTGRVSVWWLITAYLLIALGEVCLSPMGLSLVNRVAPPRSRGLLMGAWFVSLSAGGYFAGFVGAYWTRMPHSRFFLLVVGLLAVAAVVFGSVMGRVRRVLRDADVA